MIFRKYLPNYFSLTLQSYSNAPTNGETLNLMSIQYYSFTTPNMLPATEEERVVDFLFKHLDQFGDAREDIQKCMNYALGRDSKPGGLILTAKDQEQVVGAVILNKTGMHDYIPENILVYIATHGDYRGQGIGKQLMMNSIEQAEGNIALHVEPDNPAKKLYEKLGFTNKYLEMRLNKK